jgi:putative ABC transport system permease protein
MWRFAPLVLANLGRRPLRTAFTLGSIMIAFLMYGLLGALGNAFSAGAQIAGADRLLTIHRVSLVQPLPESYGSRIRRVDGVAAVSSATWFGGVYQDGRNAIPVFPVNARVYLDIYPEVIVTAEARERFLAERRGALVGRPLADEYGWKVGQTIPIRSTIWRKEDGSDTWELIVSGIFDAPETGGDARNILFHHEYFSESLARGRGLVGWYIVKVKDPDDAERVAREIDEQFANSPFRDRDLHREGIHAGLRQPGRQHRRHPARRAVGGVLHHAAGHRQHDGAVGARAHRGARRAEDARLSPGRASPRWCWRSPRC